MIENLETLLILARTGTMVEASTELRITQSAVSKRISSLERYYDRKLIQKKGRRVELTHHGRRLVDKIYPILSELRDLFIDEVTAKGQLVIGVSDAILSSWGPGVFHLVQDEMPDVKLDSKPKPRVEPPKNKDNAGKKDRSVRKKKRKHKSGDNSPLEVKPLKQK